MNQRNSLPTGRISERERELLGIPDRDPGITTDGFAMWEDEEWDELPIELPINARGLTSQSSATGSGMGRVQSAMAYRRPNGTYVTAALEVSDEGRALFVAVADDVREANAQLLSIMESWAFCGWETTCRLAGADEAPERKASGPAPISLAERRDRAA